MIRGSNSIDLATARQQKQPIYYVSFGPVGSGSFVPAIEEEFSTGPIYSATKTRKILMSLPSGGGQSITELAGTSTISGINFTLQDRDGEITKMVNTYPMKNRVVTLYGGYAGIPEAQFIKLFRGVLGNITTSQDGTGWVFTVQDFQRLVKTTGFSATTTTLSAITEDDLILTIQSAPTTSYPWFPPQTVSGFRGPVNFMKIDDEIVGYNSIAPSSTGDYNTVTLYARGLMGTTKNKHDVGATVTNAIMLDGNPIDIMLWLLLSINGDGSNGPYDVFPNGQGAEVPQDFIAVSEIEKQRDRFLSGSRFQFLITDVEDIKHLIEEEILKIVNGYPIVKNDGRLSIKLYSPAFPVDVISNFTDDNIIGIPTLDMRLQSNSGFINVVDFKYDYDVVGDTYYSDKIIVDGDSVTESEENASLQIQSRGLRGGMVFEGETLVQRFANMVFNRYGKGCPNITLSTLYSESLCEVGDAVTLKSSYIPNSFQRVMNGDPIICEIVNKTIDYVGGKVNFTLRATGFNSKDRWFIISPDGMVGYDEATDQQKSNYGFISTKLSDTVGVMGNTGDPGYKITP